MSDTPRTGLKAGWILHDDKRPQRGGWAPGGYACHCVKCFCAYSGDKRSTMCADCAYVMPEEKAVSTSDTPRTDACEVRFSTLFAGEDAMWVPSKKAREIERELNAANERIKQLDKSITGETSDGYHSFNELYEHRHALFLALADSTLDISWMSKKHHDESEMEGWFIAGIRLKEGDISYHLPMRLWNACANGAFVVLPKAPPWDGHTSKDVIDRLTKYATL